LVVAVDFRNCKLVRIVGVGELHPTTVAEFTPQSPRCFDHTSKGERKNSDWYRTINFNISFNYFSYDIAERKLEIIDWVRI